MRDTASRLGRAARPRRLLLSALALVLFGIGISSAYADHLPVDSDPDTTAPILESFAISPTSVDVRVSDATITATARITDDKSGVERVFVNYQSPSGANSILVFFSSGNRISGSEHVGDYRTTIPIDTNRESGTWTVSGASTRDVVGNTRNYTAAEARALGAVDFTVQSNRDATPPRLSAVRVTPNQLDVSSANGFATFEWDATDEGGSGIWFVNIGLSSPSGRQFMQGQAASFTPGLSAVTLRGDAITRTFTPTAGFSEVGLSQYSEPGAWIVNFVQVTDYARNTTTYQGADLAAILPSPFFEVVSTPHDAVQPAITAFRFSPSAIDVSSAPATVTAEFDVTDDLSGVQAAWLTFQSPTIAASPPFLRRTATFYEPMTSARITAGTVRGSVTFPRFDRGGTWRVIEVCVEDRVKHRRCYSGETLRVLGPTEVTVISNRLSLTPAADENPVGSQHTVTATLTNQDGPLSARTILFSVAGANEASGIRTTDANGQATFTYTGRNVGGDTITACYDANTNETCELAELKAVATKTWIEGAREPATLALSPKTAIGKAGSEHCVTATVTDASGSPAPNVEVVFSVGRATLAVPLASGTVTTGATGQATFCYTGTKVGTDTITAFADTDGSGGRNAGEPGDTASNTYEAAAPYALTLSPKTATNPVATRDCVTATVEDRFQNRVAGVAVVFTVTGAVNTGGSQPADQRGQATFCYVGPTSLFDGTMRRDTDTITAFADSNGNSSHDAGEPSDTATKQWAAGPAATLVLAPKTGSAVLRTSYCVGATAKDAHGNPASVNVVFSTSGANRAAQTLATNASGVATFCYAGTAAGSDTVRAFADLNANGTQETGEPGDTATVKWCKRKC
jgi:hypothetical protein